MNALTQMITQQLAGGAVRTISQRLGISETAANTAVQIAVPLILSALARNASQPQGAESLHEAISKDHDGSILDNLQGYLGDPQGANGAGILGHVFGSQQPTLENNLAQATGMIKVQRVGCLKRWLPLSWERWEKNSRRKDLTRPTCRTCWAVNSSRLRPMRLT